MNSETVEVREVSPKYGFMADKPAVPVGYKQTEIGVMPEDWETSSVGDEFTIQLGKMLDSERNIGVRKPYLGNRAVQWDQVDISDLSTVPMTQGDLKKFRLKKGDILVCEGGEVGRAAIWNSPLSECYYQKALHRLRPLKGFNSKLMVAILRRWADKGVLKNGVNSRAELLGDGSVRYLHYGDIHASGASVLNPDSLPFLSVTKAKTLSRLKDGDLIFADASEDIDGVGKSVELVNVGRNAVVAGLHTIAVRFDSQVLADGFKAYLQFCPEFIEALRRLAAGTKVYATTRSHIFGIEMRLPEMEEQKAISTILQDMDGDIRALKQRRAKTAALKQAMMQELLTGRIRLV